MLILKQSTATQNVLIGPFIDDTDGATPETGLTIANTDIRLSKAGGNLAAKNSGGGTTDEAGWYQITLDATDTNTVGALQLHVKVAGALMVHAEFMVVEEDTFTWFYASGAAPDTQIAAIKTETAAIVADTGTDGVVLKAAGLDADAADEIAAAVWDEDATGHQTGGTFGQAIGDPGANTETMYDAVVTDATGTNVAADVVAVKAQTVAIEADTDVIDDGTSGLVKIASDVAAVLADTGTDGVVLAANAITEAKIADNAIATEHIATGAISADSLAADTITAAKIADNAIATEHLADGAITAGTLATDTITAAKIAADAIGASEIAANAIGSSELAASAANEIADAILVRQMTESYASNGTAPTVAEALFAIHQTLMDHSISGTSWTVEKLDGTTAFTITLDDATSPTAANRA